MPAHRAAVVFAACLVTALALPACDDDDDWYSYYYFETTDVVGRVVFPNGTPVVDATVEIFLDGYIEDVEFTDGAGVYDFDDWPEEWEPFIVRATYVQPGTGIIFQGASPYMDTDHSGDTEVPDIVLFATDSAPALGAQLSASPPSGTGIGFADIDRDGRLDAIPFDRETRRPLGILKGR
jgi:hypothetical protein